MMTIEDLSAIIETMKNKEKLAQINFIIQCSNEGSISHKKADIQINKIIRANNNEWKQWSATQ